MLVFDPTLQTNIVLAVHSHKHQIVLLLLLQVVPTMAVVVEVAVSRGCSVQNLESAS